jgi:hypothetical protein
MVYGLYLMGDRQVGQNDLHPKPKAMYAPFEARSLRNLNLIQLPITTIPIDILLHLSS